MAHKRPRRESKLQALLHDFNIWPADIADLIASYAERSLGDKVNELFDYPWPGMQVVYGPHVRMGWSVMSATLWVSLGADKRCHHYETRESLKESIATRMWPCGGWRSKREDMTPVEVDAIEQWLAECE